MSVPVGPETSTAAGVLAAMQRWLSRPVLAIRVNQGPRPDYQESRSSGGRSGFVGGGGGGGGGGGVDAASPQETQGMQPRAREPMPGVTGTLPVQFPATERARLSNGIQIIYARRAAVPVTRVASGRVSAIEPPRPWAKTVTGDPSPSTTNETPPTTPAGAGATVISDPSRGRRRPE